MAGFIEGVDRSQSMLFPDRRDDWIGEDSLVRVVDFFVEDLDLQRLGFSRSAAERTGRPGYHPAVLLKLFIYGYWTNTCKDCDLKSRCTTGQERRVSRWEHEHLVEASNARNRSPSAPMLVRRSTVEHPFGTIKSWTGPCHFLTRRLSGVRTEMALNVLAYNIKRMIALVGVKGLIAAVPE